MNAGGVPNTCKSNGKISLARYTSGERVRNAYATYLQLENSPEKSGLILHIIQFLHDYWIKAPAVEDGHA